ncbi:hypothetical protein [Caballeronia sp. GAWG1-1]|uniref:hypothetical protein n=1 Tax=Caballeronia sp. GAWG1-1 TaxID=2921742 RepID=UPI0020281BDB|nr:hypothetical protein [Caballeronia sp. GAWG1-1]
MSWPIGRLPDARGIGEIGGQCKRAGTTMKSSGLESTTRQLVLLLPIFMGVIEYLLRVAMRQSDQSEFFPISLVASGISLNLAVTALPDGLLENAAEWQLRKHLRQVIFIAKLGIFASLGGVLLWIYLLLSSFSEDVKALLNMNSILEALTYYVISMHLTRYKEEVEKCWTS